MNPADYRYNAFNDSPNHVRIKERRMIPFTSPYQIRLNEVPNKADPSDMTVASINVDGSKIDDFTEVAATPSVNEFRPDYSTGANGDKTWNTGLIEFSSADAGKYIEINYSGTGTLASVKAPSYPAWWLDRGDGSDGDFSPTTNITLHGRYNFRSVYIPSGVTVKVNGYLDIRCLGAVICDGIINADGGGGRGGAYRRIGGYGASSYINGNQGHPAICGGYGGATNNCPSSGVLHGGAYVPEMTEEQINAACRSEEIKSGGGGSSSPVSDSGERHGQTSGSSGAAGGGMIRFVCSEFNFTGNMSVKGNTGSAGSGGGGVVIAICNNIIKATGTVNVSGGNGGGAGWYRFIELGG